MKKPVVLLLVIALVAVYLLGTEHGRDQRDQIIGRIKRDGGDIDAAVDDAASAIADATG